MSVPFHVGACLQAMSDAERRQTLYRLQAGSYL